MTRFYSIMSQEYMVVRFDPEWDIEYYDVSMYDKIHNLHGDLYHLRTKYN